MIKLSAVIITYNEERNIGRCLKSLRNVADEIVVVDSMSTDRTREICSDHGARFIEHEFEGHIEQKNFAMSQASHDHIISLDADEALSEKLRESVLAVKENWSADAYTVNRLTNYCGKWVRFCGWYPDRKLRLADRRKVIWGGVNPHDKMAVSEDGETSHLKGDLLHYSYYSVADHIKQVRYFSEIAAKANVKKGKRGSYLHMYLGGLFKFIHSYVIKLGIFDGYHGLVISAISGWATYLKYRRTMELSRG